MTAKTSLVLVVGAGASKEAGLPTGAELKQRIAQALDIRFEHGVKMISGDHHIAQALRSLAEKQEGSKDINPYLKASWLIRDAMPQAASIDNFIDAHRENEKISECGKLAIARCMLEAEAGSSMCIDDSSGHNRINLKRLEATWYNLFFRILFAECDLKDIPHRLSSIAIITFNYDRCIEHYFHQTLRIYYDVDAPTATELLSYLRIFHAYGSLGQLPTMGNALTIPFGATANSQQLLTIACGLKTFTEGTDETHSDIVAIRAILHSAAKVAFLGFAFNPKNLDLLYGPTMEASTRTIPIFATGRGLSESNIEVITDELRVKAGYMSNTVRFRRDLTCVQLLQEYERSLAI